MSRTIAFPARKASAGRRWRRPRRSRYLYDSFHVSRFAFVCYHLPECTLFQPSNSPVSRAGVARRFREVEALLDVTLSVARGEFFSLLGPSGCGKTTLLRISSLMEAAHDLGATGWQTFRHVTLPLISPGILAGALLAFTLSLDDFVVSFFTTGPGATTLPILIYSSVKRGLTADINALSTLLVLASVGATIAVMLLQGRNSNSKSQTSNSE